MVSLFKAGYMHALNYFLRVWCNFEKVENLFWLLVLHCRYFNLVWANAWYSIFNAEWLYKSVYISIYFHPLPAGRYMSMRYFKTRGADGSSNFSYTVYTSVHAYIWSENLNRGERCSPLFLKSWLQCENTLSMFV